MLRPARVVVAGGILAVGLAIGVRWWLEPQPSVVPPLPVDQSALDSDLAALIQTAADRVRDLPSSAQAWRELGMVYQANGMIDLAGRCHERAIALNAKDSQAWHLLGMCRAMLGDTAGAVEAAQRAAEARPQVAATHWRLGYWLLDLGEIERAGEAFGRAISIDANDPAAIVGLARVQLQRDRNEEAAALLEQLLESSSRAVPNEAHVNRLLASAYRRLGRDELADAALARSVAGAGSPQWFDPLIADLAPLEINAQAQTQRAKALVEQGYVSQGFRLFESLLRKHPERAAIHLAYAAALSERGQLDPAIELLEQAVEVQPQNAAVHVNLGAAYLTKARLGSTQGSQLLERAAAHAQRSIDIDRTFGAPHALRGEVLEELGQTQQAIACYQQAIALDAIGAQWRFLAGRAWHKVGDHGQAVGALNEAVRISPRHGEAWFMLAQAHLQLHQRDAAERALAEAQRWLGPDDPRIASAMQALASLKPAALIPQGSREQDR